MAFMRRVAMGRGNRGEQGPGSFGQRLFRSNALVIIITTGLTVAALNLSLNAVGMRAGPAGVNSLITPASSPSASAGSSSGTGGPGASLGVVEARGGHHQIVVSWTSRGIAGAKVGAFSPGQRSVVPCDTSINTCTIDGLTDGAEYTVIVTEELGGTLLDHRTVRAIPHPEALNGRFARLWFDAADGQSLITGAGKVALPGMNIAQWLDRSGQASDASQPVSVSQPTATTLNGHSAVAFSGKSIMALPATALPIGSSPSAVYVVAVMQDDAPQASCFRVALAWGAAQNNSARLIHKGCRTGQAFADTFGAWPLTRNGEAWPIDRTAVLRADFTGSGVTVAVNGRPSYVWSTSTQFPLATASAPQASLGAALWDPHGAWLGTIAEVIVLSTIPSSTEDTEIQKYLSLKWGA
jgi:hypothetical protein